MRWPIVYIVATAALASLPSGAAASPGDAPWDGAVFAGPTSPHPANISANPASMLLSTPGKHFFVGGIGTLDQLRIDRAVVDAGGGSSPGPRVAGNTMGAGGHVGFALVLPSGVFALMTSLPPPDETLAGRDALRYHTRGSRSRSFEVGSLALGYRITSRIWLGVALTYSVRDGVRRFARDTAMEAGRDPARGVTSDCGGAPCGLENPQATELWTIDLDRDLLSLANLRLTGGVIVVAPGGTLVGLTYQRPWDLSRLGREGTATVVAAPRDGGATHTGNAVLFDRLPEVVRLGSRTRVRERLDLVSEVRWRRLSRTGTDDVRTFGGDLGELDTPEIYPRPRGMHDALAVEAGLEEIDDGQRLRFGGRFGYDNGAVPDGSMSARAPWGHQVTAGAGVQVRLGSRWVMQGSYSLGWQLPITVADGHYNPIDRLDCVDSGYDLALPACDALRGGFGAPTNDGDYRRWSHVGRLTVRVEIP